MRLSRSSHKSRAAWTGGHTEFPDESTYRVACALSERRSMEMVSFDYSAEAELFPLKSRKFNRGPVGYRRFTSAAEAVRFAIEELHPDFLRGASLEVQEERFDRNGIRRLYESDAYPLVRAHRD